ncbi:hypothetical protein PsorP6_006196 [Peronosclerospora sorghi]|uniref:Uncharacterized protein n=1 Tax=Peronosclerospora sorghi TaxID=230839 RepID=A0ACC0W5Z4_9STRA|nr:hypothetical protein PsorP6_006196 [Peronosclerospora sorghi]
MALYVWGHNNSQQLGLNEAEKQVYDIRQLKSLRNEVIVDFSAGEGHSLALNEFGQVFAWGRGREGQLGLGESSTMVSTPRRIHSVLAGQVVTKIACGESHSLALTSTGDVFMWGLLPVAKPIQNVEDVSDHATIELTGLSSEEMQRPKSRDELRRHMGDSIMARLVQDSMRVYEDTDDDSKTVKVQTVRAPCMTPRLCAGTLAKLVVTNIAAGFAHSLATTKDGAVFSCGYNDNGQLGLGSRRHSAQFQRIETLDGYFIEHIACGQQHSLACSRVFKEAAKDGTKATSIRSGVCFSWGLGVLGQLGTGATIAWIPQKVPLVRPAVSVAAGSHHSVAVTDDGKVYTWGHSEYGQHGAGETFYDLQHNAHYFFPRVQQTLAETPELKIVRVCCSSHSTFALSEDGVVMSWGWNAFGVLGNGKYLHTAHPQRVFGLRDNIVVAVGAGANHCAVAVQPRGAHSSLRYDHVFAHADFADLIFHVGRPTRGECIKAHRVVLTARSSYMKGLLRVLDHHVTINTRNSGTNDGKRLQQGLLEIDEFVDIDPQVFRAFLVFLYTNRVDIVSHKRKALGQFASSVCCDALVVHCLDAWRKKGPFESLSPSSSEARQFGEDMQKMVLSNQLADVVFLWPIENQSETDKFERLPAHKAVLSQVEYFRIMFMGGFSEGKTTIPLGKRNGTVREIPLHYMHHDGVSLEAFKGLLLWIYTGCFELVSAQLGSSDMMDLYVGASRLGITVLASKCELQLIECLSRLDLESLRACEDFAERFDARRLQTTTQLMLENQLSSDC